MTEDNGAMAILICLLMVVLVGMAAVVVDAGSLYAERRELQNGADAAALAVARMCATTGSDSAACAALSSPSTATNTAKAYANANASDQLSSAVVDWPSPSSVKVTTSTETSDGGTLVLPFLAKVLDPSYNGKNVTASAVASWGGIGSVSNALPLIISICEWRSFTAQGTDFAPTPPSPWNPPRDYSPYQSYDHSILFHGSTGIDTCTAGASGADNLSGGFGWLQPDAGSCFASTNSDGFVDDKTGAAMPSACDATDFPVPQLIFVPVYDEITSATGTNTEYHIAGYGAFVLTGYRFPSIQQTDVVKGSAPCHAPDTCISGFFTKALAPAGATAGGTQMGATTIALSQ